MTEQLQKIINDEFKKIPEKVKFAIDTVKWLELSNRIGLKYSFTDPQINKLQTEVLLVLIGMEPLDDLPLNIENNLEIEKKEAENIVEETKQQIFEPISKKINEDVKKNSSYKNSSWDQSVNFIVSGGDYFVFLNKKDVINNEENN